MKLDNALVQFTRERLRTLAAVSIGLDLDLLINAIEHADAFMPIADPTRYRAEMRELQATRDLAQAMRGVQRAAERLGNQLMLDRKHRPFSVAQADARGRCGLRGWRRVRRRSEPRARDDRGGAAMIATLLDLCTFVGAVVIGCLIGGALWCIGEVVRERRKVVARRRAHAQRIAAWPGVLCLNHRGERVSHATVDELMPRVIEVEP